MRNHWSDTLESNRVFAVRRVFGDPAPLMFTWVPRPSWLGKTISRLAMRALSSGFVSHESTQIIGIRDGDGAFATGYGFELAGVVDWGVLAKFATTPLAQASAAGAPWASMSDAISDKL